MNIFIKENKYRAWDKILNQMIEWSQLSEYLMFDSDRYVIMQSTGLKDKNNVEIYEHDILQNNTSIFTSPVVVVYNPLKARYEINKALGFDHKDLPTNLKRGCVVVGNIYQNQYE